ncbi:adenosine deaminase [Primorskyibacter sp. S187A]|uniref:adenosine deaminase n=1 Tax=Primorskyibacter sp. S187A TaxID=3415130 RepID=UPI003C7E2AB5
MSMSQLPKAELHLHLEGAAPPAFIRGLAKEKSIDLQKIFNGDGTYAYRDFAHFLTVYEAACTVLQTPEDFYRLTQAVLEESASHGVVYAETFVSPDFCGGGDVVAWREYMAAMQEASEAADRALGITLRGIVTCIRHFGPEKAKAAALCAAETRGDWLVGFGMAGDENTGQPGDYAYSFDLAREAELQLTVHAGEWRGPEEIKAALDDLRVARIGHGVRAIEDLALVDRLAEDKITLEVCPISNVTLGVYPALSAHPIENLRAREVPVTISTDDPPFFHTTMTREYEALAQTFGWNEDDFAELNQNAMRAAFCDDETRARVQKRFSQ